MTSITDIASMTRSGVVNLVLERDRAVVGSGSGFLVAGGIATAWHVVRGQTYDTVRIRFADDGADDGIRLE